MRNKYFICHDPNFPEGDLWLEMSGTSCGNPVLDFWGKNEEGPVKIISLSLAEACRIEKAIAKFTEYSFAYLQRSETEE